jgi:chromosome segregation protein
LSVARLELVRFGRDREAAAARITERQSQIEAKELEKTAAEQAAEAARADLAARQQALSQLAEEHAAMRAALASIDERHRSAQGNQQRLEAQVHELTARRASLAAELERRALDRQRLLADNIGLDQRAGELAAEITKWDARGSKLAAADAAQKAVLLEIEASLKLSRAASQQAQEQRNQSEIHLVRLQSDLKHLDETCQNQLDAPIASVAQTIEVTLDEIAVAETEDKARELSKRIESLGPVNAQAAEEFDEAQKRYDFLNAQRQDVLDSIRDTERAIQEIDVESKKRFQEAFEKINANFREMFKTLFHGGLGEMRLADEDHAMESGIDIVAQPPGKKLQNVLLLSGGERAMTAMALLMAIFKYQPSPFCILDEVDAPLDEPNILRLTKLLQEMSEQTQFIVITHAKRTMEASEVMYGVTMQEPGVSKLVSVKFKEEGRAAAA